MRNTHLPEVALGCRVRAQRTARGWSQQRLADEVNAFAPEFGWRQSTVAKTEQAARPIRVDELVALARVLRVESVEDLLTAPDSAAYAWAEVLAARDRLEELEVTAERELGQARAELEARTKRHQEVAAESRAAADAMADQLFAGREEAKVENRG